MHLHKSTIFHAFLCKCFLGVPCFLSNDSYVNTQDNPYSQQTIQATEYQQTTCLLCLSFAAAVCATNGRLLHLCDWTKGSYEGGRCLFCCPITDKIEIFVLGLTLTLIKNHKKTSLNVCVYDANL